MWVKNEVFKLTAKELSDLDLDENSINIETNLDKCMKKYIYPNI